MQTNSVAFVELDSVEWCSTDRKPCIKLHSRYHAPWIIKENYFVDGSQVLEAIRRLRPSMKTLVDGELSTQPDEPAIADSMTLASAPAEDSLAGSG